MIQFKIVPPKSERLFKLLHGLGLAPNFWQKFSAMPFWIQEQWAEAVMKSGAHTSHARGYVNEIRIVQADQFSFSVIADGPFSDVVENGAPKFDMKPGMLNSRRARMGKNGKYLIVPLRHMTADLKKEGLYGKAKNLQRMNVVGFREGANATGDLVRRAMYNSGYGRLKVPGSYRNENTPWPAGAKSVSIYHGLTKAGSAGHSAYMTFRVVSEATPDYKWIHPGFKAHPVFNGLQANLKSEIQTEMQDALMSDMLQAQNELKRL